MDFRLYFELSGEYELIGELKPCLRKKRGKWVGLVVGVTRFEHATLSTQN